MIDHKKVMELAKKYEPEMVKFLRDMIKIPSESAQEREVIQRIKKEMEKVGFDEIKIDEMGNILGRVGKGKKIIAMDAHIDTVGVGDRNAWKWDPYEGKLENGVIYGRGASDQEAGMASMVYAAKIIKDLKLEGDYTLWITGTVQEEDCDGLCWQYILKEKIIDKPDVVVITEPTNLNIYRGHRGRMEIGVTAKGVSCHGSAPERGKNAVYMMCKVVNEIEKLNDRIKHDEFLGKGSVTVSYIECDTPSLCAVPDRAYIHLDRRLTQGETRESAVAEVKDAIKKAGVEASVEVLKYNTPSYTGLVYEIDKYYPTWVLPENHVVCRAAVKNYQDTLGVNPKVDKWTFSTNGVATMGTMGVPTIGFGPAHEIHAHAVTDQVPVEHLVKACAWYATFPSVYVNTK
ncbi:MAG: selenium metabolism hydrolase [Bdellovibrionales bacterium RIFOXYB1_FULL_37_110]|nr:MAG: selenium metabolism hydrolase [Bdellovibrionales bacterium RIFOXYC1_FULL_37_79]OFZ57127.1 MAG: selenium metabolism hydrolase [Bdellovibrionales bacterium RIFOXYB1_FULL_37_110]OFZ65389.1 MAG: selenium metabolism hydrolase [Bdellovibrionales bacterium RIFOXYD1_FULL_36_51]